MSATGHPTAALSASLAQDAVHTGFHARAMRLPRRPLKLATAGALAFAGAYGILSEQRYVTSSNSIVSAYVLDVRTPVDGTVTALPTSPGAAIEDGEVLAHLDNPLADHQHLDSLRTLENVADSSAAADTAEAAAFDTQRRALMARAGAHSSAVTARLRLAVDEAGSTLDAREAAFQEARIELTRARQLHDAGILSSADYDKVVSAEAVARREAEAERSALASLRDQHQAATQGLLSEPGTNNDVAYSRQRADELSIKLAETARSLAASQAQAAEAHAAVEAETARFAHLRASDLRSPVTGQIWQITAMNGERAAAGDPVVALVDCSRQFLLVEIPQERLPDIAIGGIARFRLTGESEERTGTVLAATGDPQKDPNHKFAAFPVQDTSLQLATVRVQPNAARNEPATCAVGRTARVLLPTVATNFVSRTWRQYF